MNKYSSNMFKKSPPLPTTQLEKLKVAASKNEALVKVLEEEVGLSESRYLECRARLVESLNNNSQLLEYIQFMEDNVAFYKEKLAYKEKKQSILSPANKLPQKTHAQFIDSDDELQNEPEQQQQAQAPPRIHVDTKSPKKQSALSPTRLSITSDEERGTSIASNETQASQVFETLLWQNEFTKEECDDVLQFAPTHKIVALLKKLRFWQLHCIKFNT